MRTKLKWLSVFVIVMMFFALVSGGCGGGGGGSSSSKGNGNDNYGWDSDPDPNNGNQNGNGNNNNGNDNNQNGNNNGNGNQNDDDNNQNGNDNGNENGNNGNNGSPVTINGTWEIVSGYAIVSNDKGESYSLTYKPGRIGEIGINMSQNTSQTYYGYYGGLYTLKLSGENVIGNGAQVSSMMIDYTYDDFPGSTTQIALPANIGYKYIGNGSYEMTDKDVQISFSAYFFRSTLTLENSSTLRWSHWQIGNEAQLGTILDEVLEVLVFKKVR